MKRSIQPALHIARTVQGELKFIDPTSRGTRIRNFVRIKFRTVEQNQALICGARWVRRFGGEKEIIEGRPESQQNAQHPFTRERAQGPAER